MTSLSDLHPEFGYFCPSPRLLRDIRIAFISVLLGTTMGGIGVIALGTDRDSHSYLSLRGGMASSDPETLPFATTGATPADTVEDVTQGEPDTSKANRVVSEETDRDVGDTAAKRACKADKWIYSDGKCLAPKPRRVRVHETPDGSTVAGVLGSRSDDAPPPAAAASGALAVIPSDQSPASASPPTSEGAADNATTAATPPTVAAPRKPLKTARAQNRRRDEGGDDYYDRDARADFRSGRRFPDDDYSRRGSGRRGAYAAERPPAPNGLWSWSGSW
jgi:hypothetical protein